MAGLTTFLIVYLFGGLTFLPLLVAIAIYAWTRPVLPDSPDESTAGTLAGSLKQHTIRSLQDDYKYDGIVLPGDDVKALESVRQEHAQERTGNNPSTGGAKKHRHDPTDDFATAGYFAVHRKYVAMGVNSKPIEPGSSVGPAPVAPPSPSVYQTFFRSMLNKKSGPDTVDISNAASPRPKNARNMFYVVLRHGHLILFDDDQQVDVRHVIKLADHDVGICSSSDAIPEGELFIKRNAVRLSPKNLERAKAHNAPTPQPWFFYCENCSEKEDFYFALLRSQERAPQPHDIDVRHLTALMERLHASEEAAEMRWFNALLGRLFLGVYKTSDVLKFVESKVITKLSRMPRPNFISSLVVQRVDIGETTPQITSPRLKTLTAEGECIIEADVRYSGRFEIDLAATLRVSTPIGQQEVKTSLAVVLTHLEGHILFKIKAPPSNRIWFSFRHMPKIEMETRPIIMARQLTWPVFIQMIEGKIKEAISESIVLPFWDDTPFFPTEKKKWRGGLWEDPMDNEHEGTPIRTSAAGGVSVDAGVGIDTESATSTGVAANTREGEENISPAVLRLRRLSKTHSAPISPAAALSSSFINTVGTTSSEKSKSTSAKKISRKQHSNEVAEPGVGTSPPKRLSRTTSALASPSEPTVGTNRSHAEASIPSSSPPKNGKQASTAMSWLSSGTLQSRKSSVSSEESSIPGHTANRSTNGLNGSSKDEYADGSDPIFSVSDSEQTEGQPTTTLYEITDSKASSMDRRSIASHSARASSSSLAGIAGPSSGPSIARKKSIEPSFTTTITSDSSTPPAKRSAVLAAAMTGAAQSAKRWGINALQRRAAAAADRKAKGNLEHRTSSGEPLDLSKPMGGGRPLPPPGEPLPMPSELALAMESTSAANTPTKPAPVGRQGTSDVTLQGQAHPPIREQKIKRKQLQPQVQSKQVRQQDEHSQRGQSTSEENISQRRQNTGGGLKGSPPSFEQQDMLVVEAPIDSDSEDSDMETQETHESDEGHDVQKHETPHEIATEESNGAFGEALNFSDQRPEGNSSEDSGSVNQTHLGDTPCQMMPPDVDSTGRKTEGSGRESPVADEEADADDAQWGTLAESVISAFLEGGDEGQVTADHKTRAETEKQTKDAPLIPSEDSEIGGTHETEPYKESPSTAQGKQQAIVSA